MFGSKSTLVATVTLLASMVATSDAAARCGTNWSQSTAEYHFNPSRNNILLLGIEHGPSGPFNVLVHTQAELRDR